MSDKNPHFDLRRKVALCQILSRVIFERGTMQVQIQSKRARLLKFGPSLWIWICTLAVCTMLTEQSDSTKYATTKICSGCLISLLPETRTLGKHT